MIQRDYIMRMVEEFGKFLAAIVGLKREGNFGDALNKIDDVYKGMIDLEPKVLKSIDVDELLDFLQNEKQFDNLYLKMIAELLFEEGQIYHESGDPVSARNVLEKAKVLINYLMESDTTFSFDWYEKLSLIDQIIGNA
ncbi:MAG: hypothetical protein KAQ62_01030 [Cyclobacteriaceae bacterium]|nr:hypothetical protein [Cyclobacteriaceae bacterium]MCK5471102.1 hypothetical protein [Cyclobacteriaceae bacterium]